MGEDKTNKNIKKVYNAGIIRLIIKKLYDDKEKEIRISRYDIKGKIETFKKTCNKYGILALTKHINGESSHFVYLRKDIDNKIIRRYKK